MALQLVVSNPTPVVHKRPFKTIYYRSETCKPADWTTISRAATDLGAIKASVMRLVINQYRMAVVHNEDGVVIYRLIRHGRQIKITGLFKDLWA